MSVNWISLSSKRRPSERPRSSPSSCAKRCKPSAMSSATPTSSKSSTSSSPRFASGSEAGPARRRKFGDHLNESAAEKRKFGDQLNSSATEKRKFGDLPGELQSLGEHPGRITIWSAGGLPPLCGSGGLPPVAGRVRATPPPQRGKPRPPQSGGKPAALQVHFPAIRGHSCPFVVPKPPAPSRRALPLPAGCEFDLRSPVVRAERDGGQAFAVPQGYGRHFGPGVAGGHRLLHGV